ncbi:MAG TPA: hypothetical protein DFR83_20240, partial [Deltaproteobacteria bacterium]|nr:hypothetical protein [Deltaproteobacteria bacterium]
DGGDDGDGGDGGDGGSGSTGGGTSGGGSSGSDGGSSGGDTSGEGDGSDTDDGGSDEGEGSGGGRTFSSSFGMLEHLTNETYQAGESCLQSSFMNSNTPADCSFCDFSFEYIFRDSGNTSCATNPWGDVGAVVKFGVGDYYGDDYVVYGYYGDWVPAFPAYNRTGDYAYFYRYDEYDYPYEYNDSMYYLTSIWAGYMVAYE